MPTWVYPRESGETANAGSGAVFEAGLSPRVRGNPGALSDAKAVKGSIPASAGKPTGVMRFDAGVRVYPRECGETDAGGICSRRREGLSPRVRGNQRAKCAGCGSPGSIPASAGKPDAQDRCGDQAGVYPRECGETGRRWTTKLSMTGLSPRVRGNRLPQSIQRSSPGSIPASAGKPSTGSRLTGSSRVYPRECGETVVEEVGRLIHLGLSPRVRGNHRQVPG